jgi:hypothetical protein
MAEWKSLQVEVPGKDLLEPARATLEQLLLLLDVLKALLDTVKVFLIDFGNPVRALVEALIGMIQEVFLALKVSGVFALFHVPNPLEDTNFDNHKGFDAFTNVFKQSLYDMKDSSRPQPRVGSTKGGFVLLVVAADSPYSLLGRVRQLLRFFNRDFTSPRYEAPQNIKVAPIGPGGDPILSVADVFTLNPDRIGLTWDLPTSSETPDAGFHDVISRVANEFVPPKFLIEKSKGIDPAAGLIDKADILDPEKAGKVEHSVEKLVAGASGTVEQRQLLRDSYDDLVIKFTECIVLDTTAITGLIGQAGRMRYVDEQVEPDVTYYYRVRAFSGELDISNGQILFSDPLSVDGRADPKVVWPSTSSAPDAICVVGKPSAIVAVRLPAPRDGAAATFDVMSNLRRVFQAAFTCDFHRSAESPNPVGQGSMTKLAGPVAAYSSEALLDQIRKAGGNTTKDRIAALLATTSVIEFPWENRGVRRQSARLADAVGSAFLETGGGTLETFRTLLQAPGILSLPTLQDALEALTNPDLDDLTQGQNFDKAYADATFRDALLSVVGFVQSFTGGGVSPDWISVSPLRDIVPWSGEILYSLLDKIQALVDAFGGVVSELNDFISLLQRKIDTLERLLEQLISVLNFIESLQIGAYILFVPEIDGNVTDWVQTVESADGTVPPTGPGGYSAGVALAYVSPNVSAISSAFSLIFGA